ncbi:hypothetical protein MNBD_GAMMA03-1271 [hydrothermal vent metagenome]|uniref:Uncharacterized protein n=1 Tax=hydrothermal vent metagenome TaxID=652676 RepID=A0A3B0W030_9ZZZZ
MKLPLAPLFLNLAANYNDLGDNIKEFIFNVPDQDRNIDDYPAFDLQIKSPKPRWCCAIGWESALEGLSGSSISLSRQELFGHLYGGTGYTGALINVADRKIANFVASITDTNPEYFHEQGIPRQPASQDPVGYVYTSRGGLIDIGHVRGLADRTRHMAVKVYQHIQKGEDFQIYSEKGKRVVRMLKKVPSSDPALAALLGAKIAYECSIWHEIVTFFTWEQYSAFSPEDNYSNLLGCYIGFNALFDRKNNYNVAVNVILFMILSQLKYQTKEVTEKSVDYINDYWFQTNTDLKVEELPGYFEGYNPRWWTKELRNKVQLELLRRHFDVTKAVSPWIISEVDISGKKTLRDFLRKKCGYPIKPIHIQVPDKDLKGNPLSDYYRMEINVDTEIIPASYLKGLKDPISSTDFPELIERMRKVVRKKYGDRTDFPD